VERQYWLSRESEEAELARCAETPEAQLAHHELANQYGAKAAEAEVGTLAIWGIERIEIDQYWVDGFRYPAGGGGIAKTDRGAAE